MPALLPENTQPDIRGSTLAPKEPYHIPGYTGHNPQCKYQCSETYGVCTNRLLTSAKVQKSPNSVLQPIELKRSQTVPLPTGFHDIPKLQCDNFNIDAILKQRRSKWGHHVYKPNMRSGYMGFVPKVHFSSYHSKTFSDNCNTALRDFAQDQSTANQKRNELVSTMLLQRESNKTENERQMVGTRHTLPLRSLRNNIPPFASVDSCQYHDSPYFLPEDHHMKSFKSGFAGHVPFYKDLGGHGFPIVTNQALTEFSRERKRIKQSANEPLNSKQLLLPSRTRKLQNSTRDLFLVESGLLPRYAGYVPGQKFRFGHTFGDATVNSLNLPLSAAT